MIKRLLTALFALIAATAFAAVDVNKATQAELEGVKGIGPAIAGKMLDERKKSPFKDWADMVDRVKGVGDGNAAKFSTEGLTVNGQGFKGAAAPAAKPAAEKAAPATATKAEASKPAAAPAMPAPAAAKAADTKPAAAAPTTAASKADPKADAKAAKAEAKAQAKADKAEAAAKAKAEKDAAKAKEDDAKKAAKAEPAASAAKK